MNLKPATLAALNRMDDADADRAACAIVAHFYGSEHGVECISIPDQAMHPTYSARYVNRGDTYDETLLRDSDTGWTVTSWGDWYERAEDAYAEGSNETRCEWCGAWSEWERDESECAACEGYGDTETGAECDACHGDGVIVGNESTYHCAACGHRDE